MELRAADRIKILREMMGLTIPGFAEAFGLDPIRCKNIEYKKVKASEDEFEKIGVRVPEFGPFIMFNGPIYYRDIKNSENEFMRLIAARLDAGFKPKSFDITGLIKYD